MSVSMDKICRTCLTESGTLMAIWPPNRTPTSGEEPSSIVKMLKVFTAIEPSKGDGLPEKVCINCISEMNRAFLLKKKCEQSDNTLRAYLNQMRHSRTANNFKRLLLKRQDGRITNENTSIINDSQIQENQSGSYQCGICHNTFAELRILLGHIAKSHGSRTEFICAKCKLNFTDNEEYLKHMNSLHPAAKTYKCKLCPKSFALFSTLKNHMKNHLSTHSEKRQPLVCEIRGNGLTREIITMKEHMIRKEFKKTFKCIECGEIYKTKNGLNVHFRTHTASTAALPLLRNAGDATYSTNTNTNTSLDTLPKQRKSTHSGEGPYTCDICLKQYNVLASLKSHRRAHEGKRTYTCSHSSCTQSFAQRSEYLKHMKTHAGERPYKCTKCNLTFQQDSGLKLHMKYHGKSSSSSQ